MWKAYCKPNGVHVAIKVMDLEKITTSFEDIMVGEALNGFIVRDGDLSTML